MKPVINLNENEQLLFESQPQPGMVLYLFATKFLQWLGVLSLVYLYIDLKSGVDHYNLFAVLLDPKVYLVLIVISATGFFICQAVTKQHWYFLTNQRCINYSGFWGISKNIIPYQRIANVELSVNPVFALLKISAVYLVLPGSLPNQTSNRTDANAIIGLSPAQAEQVVNIISQHAVIK